MLKSIVNILLTLVFAETAIGVPIAPVPTDVVGPAVRAYTQTLPLANERGPEKVRSESLGVVTDAPTVLVRDVRSGAVLLQQESAAQRPIASITKLMTAMVVLDHGKADAAPAVVRQAAVAASPSSLRAESVRTRLGGVLFLVNALLQLELFVRDEESAIQWLRQQVTRKPQTFQEIHPQFLKELGQTSVSPEEKFVFKKKDIAPGTMTVHLLSA